MRQAIYSHFTHLVALAILLAGCVGGDSVVSETDTDTDTPETLTLSWHPVKGNIAGYNIYYGTTEGQYRHNIRVPDSEAKSYVIKSLPKGTYYFVITSYDKDGNESEHSEVARITLK